ncbi:MAG: hypothetical protein QXL17_04875 [Candidatus Thermoplasmatota archaeon]
MMKREPAWRVFAAEFNDTTFELRATEEKTPSYIVTPLGSKINRIFVTGVLTDVENISEEGEYLRAHVSDPTGVFTLYSGQYQPDATSQLQAIEVPSFIAVIGKVRTYIPEEGGLFVSIRPELIREVDSQIRDRWILDTCYQTKQRIIAFREALKMKQPNVYDLRKLGYSKELSEGIITALQHYGPVDISRYVALIRESLQFIIPSQKEVQDIQKPPQHKIVEPKKKKKTEKKPMEDQDALDDTKETIETLVLDVIKKLEGAEGAAWDAIIDHCKKKKITEDQIEEALTSLMDKGFIYEPVLGTIKTT